MLTVFIKSIDRSPELENYLSDSITVSLLAGETIDIGYYKPIGDVYIDLKAATQISNTLEVEYYNGSWAPVSVADKTKQLNRSGFLSWNKNLMTDWKATTLHGKELFWVRVSATVDITGLIIKGLNLVFSDDNDLKEAYPNVSEFLPENEDSFIIYHQEARNEIITYLRNKGKSIQEQEKLKLLDHFDLHNFNEVRQASKYLVLANIFYNESDAVDDKWKQKADGFKKKFGDSINLYYLSLDLNNDGVQQNYESSSVQHIRIHRL